MERRDFEQKTNIDQGGLVEGGGEGRGFMYVISGAGGYLVS